MQLRPTAALALTAAVALGLAGCSAGSTTAEDEAPAASQTTSEETTTEESGAAEETAVEGAPEGWPAEVPVPQGEYQEAQEIAGQTAGVWMMADTAAAEAYAGELEAAGFTPIEGGTTEVAGNTAVAYQGPSHIIGTSIIEAGGQVLLSVAVQGM